MNSNSPNPIGPAVIHELRLVLADQNLADSVFEVLGRPSSIGVFEFSAGPQTQMDDRYFDSPGRGLRSSRTSLRLRHWRERGESAWQWKQPDGEHAEDDVAKDLKYELREWGAPADDREATMPGELMAVVASALGQGRADVEPVGTVLTRRQVVNVGRNGDEVARLHLDRVRIELPGSDRVVETSEVEVRGEDTHELIYLGEALAAWFGMIRVRSSKPERHIPARGPAKRVLLDMDPGVDDALALLYLLATPDRPNIDGITIVGGNVPVRECARNAYRICRWACMKGLLVEIPPIGLGVDLSDGKVDAASVHGIDGMGGLDWGEVDQDFESLELADACELQRRALEAHPGEVTIVTTGPCSNLARLLEEHPDALRKVREIIVMGGAFFDCGNRGPKAEFNIHSDSASARKLLEFCRSRRHDSGGEGHLPLTFVGLDVTHRVILERAALTGISGEMAMLAAGISSHYMDFYRTVLGLDGCPLHDPLAMAVALHPEFVVREPYHVEIVSLPDSSELDGITVADCRPCVRFKEHQKEVTEVCVSVNSRAFLDDFLARMASDL